MARYGIITEADARNLPIGSSVELEEGGHVTPLARDTLRERRITVMFVDAAVHGIHELHDVNELTTLKSQVKGGGGTDMTVGLAECMNLPVKPETIIVFTDGYTPFGEDTGIPTIWCITSEVKAPWGVTVNVKIPH